MKVAIVFFALVAFAVAQIGGPDSDAQILTYSSDNIGVDGYDFAFDTSNGISQSETGKLVNAGSENEALEVSGSYKYTRPDGVDYSVSYVADENGFRPVITTN